MDLVYFRLNGSFLNYGHLELDFNFHAHYPIKSSNGESKRSTPYLVLSGGNDGPWVFIFDFIDYDYHRQLIDENHVVDSSKSGYFFPPQVIAYLGDPKDIPMLLDTLDVDHMVQDPEDPYPCREMMIQEMFVGIKTRLGVSTIDAIKETCERIETDIFNKKSDTAAYEAAVTHAFLSYYRSLMQRKICIPPTLIDHYENCGVVSNDTRGDFFRQYNMYLDDIGDLANRLDSWLAVLTEA